MPLLANNDLIEVWFRYTFAGQVLMTGGHYQIADMSPGGIDLIAGYDGISSEISDVSGLNAALAGCLSDSITDIKYTIQTIYPVRYINKVYNGSPSSGTNSPSWGDMPPNVSAAITVRASSAGPTKRGTKHVGGLTDLMVANGMISSSGMTKLQSYATQLTVTLNCSVSSTTWKCIPTIFHRPAPGSSVDIYNSTVQPTVRVERRRTVGLGI